MPFRKKLRILRQAINRLTKFDVVRVYGNATLGSHLREVLRDYRIDIVLDVGANLGQFGGELRSAGFRGDIHSFEPVSQTYNKLLRVTAGDKRWNAHNFALGDKAGKMAINVFEHSALASVFPASQWGRNRFPALKAIREEEIAVSTVDEFLQQALLDKSKRIFLKMDTQGYDTKVFTGARNSLGQICGLLSELSLIPIYDGMPSYTEALAMYNRSGFFVSGAYPMNRNEDLSLVEMDCVLVRRDCFRATGL